MAYDETLAERIRGALARVNAVTEIRMFGGLCWTIRGNMAVGIIKDELIVRIPPDAGEASLKQDRTRLMDVAGKPVRGFLLVEPQGLRSERMLQGWVDKGVAFASALPAKKPNRKAT